MRGEYLSMVLDKWRNARNRVKKPTLPQEAELWSQVVDELPLRKKPFEKGEVHAPQIGAVDWNTLNHAAFVTVPDWPEEERRKFLQAIYFGTYFGDETGQMIDILDC